MQRVLWRVSASGSVRQVWRDGWAQTHLTRSMQHIHQQVWEAYLRKKKEKRAQRKAQGRLRNLSDRWVRPCGIGA